MRQVSFLVPGAREESPESSSRPKLDGILRFAVLMAPCPTSAEIFIGVRLSCILETDPGNGAEGILTNGSEHGGRHDATQRDKKKHGSIQEFPCARADTISLRPAA